MGSALAEKAQRLANDLDISTVELNVMAFNDAAATFLGNVVLPPYGKCYFVRLNGGW